MSGQVGKYEVRGTLGAGAYGTVYLGWQDDLQRPVAIKELGRQLIADPAFLQGFREEARIMALLDHPNCVKVFDFIELDDRAFLVSEYVDGASLRQVVLDAGALSPQQALGVLKGSLKGLGHAHQLGLVHRDVKPENILADREGTSKLADFGQAYFGAGPGAAGALTGSPPYMSPEQARGGVCDARSDLYSAGAILFEFLTGSPPFLADNPMAIMRAHVNDPVPDPRKLNKKLPKQATRMMSRALAKDPDKRFQSADEMLAALEDTARAGYGKNWEQSAAIKGLVAASAAGVAVAVGAAGAAAAAGAAGATGSAAVGSATVGAGSAGAVASGGGVSGGTIALGAGAAAVVGAAAVGYVVVSNAIFGHNLVVNGNAETGSAATTTTEVFKPDGWTTTGQFTEVRYGGEGFPSAGDPGPPDRGQNFFAGGNSPQSTASQTVDVSGGSGGIDSGGKRYDLSAYLGGLAGQGDSATVEVTFEDASGRPLVTARIGPVTDLTRKGRTALVKSEATGEVPKGTRKVLVRILMVRTDGTYNDGYADDVSLTIS